MSAIQHTDTSGKVPQQQTDITIIRNLQARVAALEKAIALSQGITFVSPDGSIHATLTIDNAGVAVWTTTPSIPGG